MELNKLLTTIENIEHSIIVLYPETNSPFDTHRIECTLCSDDRGKYYFTLNDNPQGKRIYNTTELPPNIKTIEFQITFNIPQKETT